MRTSISTADAVREAQDYLRRGLPFHAHEVLEMRWRCCPESERPLWQGLAQAAAGMTHAARGNDIGAQRLRERGRANVAAYTGDADPPTRALIAALIAEEMRD